jgi:Ca2+-transporting ATPase
VAIANIPEEFPVVLTVFLALGAWRMAKHRALVRRPPAIEALGSVTVLCTDKTGTLTENRMRVASLVDSTGRQADAGEASMTIRALLQSADQASPDDLHDPMEQAIRDAADALPGSHERSPGVRVREYPLTPERLATTHVWRSPDLPAAILHVACKGAPETVAGLCALPDRQWRQVLDATAGMAARGLRVLAVARASWAGEPADLPPTPHGFDFEWLGLVGLADPLRPEVPAAVAEARAAGIRVVMLTGDHPATARAIARQAGLVGDDVVSGSELAALDDAAFAQRVAGSDLFARVPPQQKLRLVQALAKSGEVVAMTGDGVNDAPALMASHVGVAMGQRGTDVAREAASIVLLDDNFATVVRAIRLGRVIYDNIERAVQYILAVHVPITGLAVLPLLLGDPLVLLPLHVVFLQLIIDPALSLVYEREPPAPNVMQRPPRQRDVRLLNPSSLLRSFARGALVLAAVTGTYLLGRALDLPAPQLAALAFIALVGGNLGLLLVTRGGGWRDLVGLRRNLAFWIVALAALAMLALVVGAERAVPWFGFSPPPAGLALLALVSPWLLLGIPAGLRRIWPGHPGGDTVH